MSSNSICNDTRDKQMELPLCSHLILLSLNDYRPNWTPISHVKSCCQVVAFILNYFMPDVFLPCLNKDDDDDDDVTPWWIQTLS